MFPWTTPNSRRHRRHRQHGNLRLPKSGALSKRFFRWHRYKFSIDFGYRQNVDTCQANFEFDSEQRRPHLTCHLVTPFIFRNENATKWLSRFFLAGRRFRRARVEVFLFGSEGLRRSESHGGIAMRLCRASMLLFSVILSCSLRVLPQTAVTSLHGTVVDPGGAVTPEADITLTNGESGFKQTRKSNSEGEYSFQQIPPGQYTVRITASGFAPQVRQIELLVNQTGRLDVSLALQAASSTVEVYAQTVTLNTNDATIGTPFNQAQIQALPFEGNNVLDLLSLQGGVMFLGRQSDSQMDSDSRSGSVNGARSDQNNYTLDGLDDNNQNKGYAFEGVVRSTRASVEEFRVVTTNSNADSGHSSGAQVTLVTRSETNSLHGTAYEYHRPTNIVANDWFN